MRFFLIILSCPRTRIRTVSAYPKNLKLSQTCIQYSYPSASNIGAKPLRSNYRHRAIFDTPWIYRYLMMA